MDYQVLLNAAFGVISFLGGWLLKTKYAQINQIREDYDELYDNSRDDYRSLSNAMHELALSLPEKYVAKQDLKQLTDFINERFDKIESKLDQINKS